MNVWCVLTFCPSVLLSYLALLVSGLSCWQVSAVFPGDHVSGLQKRHVLALLVGCSAWLLIFFVFDRKRIKECSIIQLRYVIFYLLHARRFASTLFLPISLIPQSRDMSGRHIQRAGSFKPLFSVSWGDLVQESRWRMFCLCVPLSFVCIGFYEAFWLSGPAASEPNALKDGCACFTTYAMVNNTCVPCPPGADCVAGTSIHNIHSKFGYVASLNDNMTFFKCLNIVCIGVFGIISFFSQPLFYHRFRPTACVCWRRSEMCPWLSRKNVQVWILFLCRPFTSSSCVSCPYNVVSVMKDWFAPRHTNARLAPLKDPMWQDCASPLSLPSSFSSSSQASRIPALPAIRPCRAAS